MINPMIYIDNIPAWTKILFTCNCPSCGSQHTREGYLEEPLGCVALTECSDCFKKHTNQYGDIIVELPNIKW